MWGQLLKYFSGTAISRFLNTLLLLAAVDSPLRLDLYLKYVELFTETLSEFPSFVRDDSSLLNGHKLPEVSEKLSLYSIKLYIDITIWRLWDHQRVQRLCELCIS